MSYIFVIGAPGSKWSSVVKNIYYSASIDRSDYSDQRTYYHDASGELQLMHLGAYFDPGMEYGDFFDKLSEHSKKECEKEFDRPFTGEGVRIIKSHVFAHHIDFIKACWPTSRIVLVYRPNDACLGWWVRCGHFNITYPKYDQYYKDLRTMSHIIDQQNSDIRDAWRNYNPIECYTNTQLCRVLGIDNPSDEYKQDYKLSDIQVGVL
jgi:hypothetical protein